MIEMKKFEYFFNAICYTSNILSFKYRKCIGYTVDSTIFFIARILLPKIRYHHLKQHVNKVRKSHDKITPNLWFGDTNFFVISMGYCNFIFLIFISVLIKYFKIALPYCITCVIVISLCYIPIERAVYHSNKYKRYFKRFQSKNSAWHRRWEIYFLMYFAVAVLLQLIGFKYYFSVLYR